MPKVLVVDDEPLYHKMVAYAIRPLAFEITLAANGKEALAAVRSVQPDLIISDVMMPEMNGYELVRTLRRDPRFAQTPILMLTSEAELEDKLNSFEAGADDHMTKPFEPAELIARITVLMRRAQVTKATAQVSPRATQKAHTIAVHSLRGGLGCSSLAINLSLALHSLWQGHTLLLDTVHTTGQVALMLNASLKRTWADVARIPPEDLDMDALQTIVGEHESGLQFIAAPSAPDQAEMLTGSLLRAAIDLLRLAYDYMVFDTTHDFNEVTLQVLDEADVILLVLAPEMASARAAVTALETYHKLHYPPEKIKLILNWTFARQGLARKQLENALRRPMSLIIPFAPEDFIAAINFGRPLFHANPENKLSALLEDFAFHISRDQDKKHPPSTPSEAYNRLAKRLRQPA